MSEVVCPRCELRVIRPGEEDPGQSLSRMTRDDGARVYICSDCAVREAMREHVGLAPIPLADWPRNADELAMEDELRN
jgi:DNA-directed RNA polymerase subunit RPC12/RpoP